MGDAKTWSDQPDAVLEAIRAAEVQLRHGRSAEVREARPDGPTAGWYVTIGNLFWSETFYCIDARAAFHLLSVANERMRPKMPFGVRRVEERVDA